MQLKVSYIWSERLLSECDRLPAVPKRASLVHSLISAFEILQHVQVIQSKEATFEDLRLFHSELYIDHLKTFKELDDEYSTTDQDEEFGFGYDCSPVPNMYELVTHIAGSSITAARCLNLGLADVAINWCGGWHHAQRFNADGFCYVNDIVIAIEELRNKFPKVLYIDLDVHHGNGVQDAYNLSKTVFTLSFHKYEPGFYPGTGGLEDIGNLVGKGYSVNVPLQAYYSDSTFNYVFGKIFSLVEAHFAPDAIVVQCGADALAGDPNGGANLTLQSFRNCIQTILEIKKPTMMLGGGGYNHANAARLWATLTAFVAGVTLDEEIPEHDLWPEYGPDFMLEIRPTLARDANKKTYLDQCISTIQDNLEKYLGVIKSQVPINKNFKLPEKSQEISNITQFKEDNIEISLNNFSENEVQEQKDEKENSYSTDVYDFI